MSDTAETTLEERIKVIDTNILLTNPQKAFESFRPSKPRRKNVLIIPVGVLGELDKFKGEMNTERGMNSRHTSRLIGEYKQRHGGNLYNGIPVADNYLIKSAVPEDNGTSTPIDHIEISPVDKELIRICLKFKAMGKDTELITQDSNLANIAEAMGIEVSDWRAERVVQSIDEIDAGWFKIELDDALKDLFMAEGLSLDALEGLPAYKPNLVVENGFTEIFGFDPKLVLPNNYFCFIHPAHSDKKGKSDRWLLGAYDPKSGLVKMLDKYRVPNRDPQTDEQFGARNLQQRLALDALFNPEYKYVTLMGYAGTGKTFLAIAAGIIQAYEKYSNHKYTNILIARPVVSAHQTVGYLKGNLHEKLGPWMQPIFDNISVFAGIDRNMIEDTLDTLHIEIGSIEHIRGRSLGSDFVIIDEAQNLSGHEAKLILTRAGDSTKMVFVGDPYQIDTNHVNILSCGLVYAAQRMNDLPYTATVGLNIGERSELSKDAAQRL